MKRKVRVGIDIDGVLRDFGHQFAKFAKEQHGITLQTEDYMKYGFPTVKVNGKPLVTQVFANPKIAEYMFTEAPPITSAKTGYKMLVENPAFDVYVVSNQKKGHEEFSNRWLAKHGFDRHTKTFYERNKLNAPVQVLIDDKVSHVVKFQQAQREGILIDAVYNVDENVPQSIHRCMDLIDAYKVLDKKYG